VRGHTDGLPYAAGRTMNNWLLSSARAEATRKALADNGIGNARFMKIEGVADRDPFIANDIYDPRNRRMSIILAWSQSPSGESGGGGNAPVPAAPQSRAEASRRMLDMGGTGLPDGAVPINAPPSGVASGKVGDTVRKSTH